MSQADTTIHKFTMNEERSKSFMRFYFSKDVALKDLLIWDQIPAKMSILMYNKQMWLTRGWVVDFLDSFYFT